MKTFINPLKLEERCVLVLGAGASHPYGFPIGVGLKRIILQQQNTSTKRLLTQAGFSEELIVEFQNVLRNSSYPTIDIFLEKMENFREIGSYYIVLAIMSQEGEIKLFPKHDWYGRLFDILNLENEHPKTSNLTVVTLNYDRSLEHFLKNVVEYDCSKKHRDFAKCKRDQIKIIHAHGSFGEYPAIDYDGNLIPRSNPAGPFTTLEKVKSAAARIKIISDKLEDTDDFKLAQNAIAEASNVIFLGFGYNEKTLIALLQASKKDNQKYYGTTYGLHADVVQRVRDHFKDNIALGDSSHNCQSYLHILSQEK